MKSFIFASFALMLASSSSFAASGKNLVICGWNDNDDSVTIRQDSNGELVALVSMLDHGTLAYKVTQEVPPSNIVGAGLTFIGHGVTLHVNTDGPATVGGSMSTLSVPALSIKNEGFDCKVQE